MKTANRFAATVATALAALALSACGQLEDASFEGDESYGLKEDAARVGRFEIYKGKDGRFYFHLLAGNGQKVLASQGYSTETSAKNGIDSVRANATTSERVELLESKDLQWYFNVTAQNGEIIGTSELYTTKSNAQRGMETVTQLVKSSPEYTAPTSGTRFTMFKGLDSKHYFHLRAANGEIVVQSEGYSSRAKAVQGANSVRSNGADARRYTMKEANDGQWFFVIKATNGQQVGRGELYLDKSGAERGAASVQALLKAGVAAAR